MEWKGMRFILKEREVLEKNGKEWNQIEGHGNS